MRQILTFLASASARRSSSRRHARPVDLDAQVVACLVARGHTDGARETVAVAEANVQHARAGLRSNPSVSYRLVPGHVHTEARPQLAERRLLAPRALALPSQKRPRRRRPAESNSCCGRDYNEDAHHSSFSIVVRDHYLFDGPAVADDDRDPDGDDGDEQRDERRGLHRLLALRRRDFGAVQQRSRLQGRLQSFYSVGAGALRLALSKSNMLPLEAPARTRWRALVRFWLGLQTPQLAFSNTLGIHKNSARGALHGTRAASATMRLLWLLLASSYHACADPELVEAAIRRMEERGQHDLVEDVRRRLAEQAGKEDEFEQHYAAAVHFQRRAEAAEAAPQPPGADPQTAALMAQIRAQEATKQQQLPDAGDVLAKIRAFEANNRKPQDDLAALAASFGAEKARGPSQVWKLVMMRRRSLMAKIRADEAKIRADEAGNDAGWRRRRRADESYKTAGGSITSHGRRARRRRSYEGDAGIQRRGDARGGAARSGAPKASGGGGIRDREGGKERRRRVVETGDPGRGGQGQEAGEEAQGGYPRKARVLP